MTINATITPRVARGGFLFDLFLKLSHDTHFFFFFLEILGTWFIFSRRRRFSRGNEGRVEDLYRCLNYITRRFHPVKSREARKLLHILLNDTEVGLVPVFSINLSRIGNVTAWKRKKEKKKVTQFFLQISTFELLFEQSIIMIGKVETIFVSCLKIERSKWIDRDEIVEFLKRG